jgi:hypothetical protein
MAIQTDGVSMVGNTSIRLENPSKRLALLVFCLLIIPDPEFQIQMPPYSARDQGADLIKTIRNAG